MGCLLSPSCSPLHASHQLNGSWYFNTPIPLATSWPAALTHLSGRQPEGACKCRGYNLTATYVCRAEPIYPYELRGICGGSGEFCLSHNQKKRKYVQHVSLSIVHETCFLLKVKQQKVEHLSKESVDLLSINESNTIHRLEKGFCRKTSINISDKWYTLS